MAKLYSNELKAVVVADNFLDNPLNVMKENCLTVQNFSYECVHKRNNSGQVYGPTEPVFLKFKIRVNSPYHAKPFYSALKMNQSSDYSFLFNVTYNPFDRLSDYEDGMIVNGYVVRVEEDYHSSKNDEGLDEQMMLNVIIQVCAVTYLGKENHYTSTFIK